MKATLLIKNIASLYTCNSNFKVFHNAFLAMHHDKIIDLGEHDYEGWLDDATRIIDAGGECVIPAFLDPAFNIDEFINPADLARIENEALSIMKKNGILSLFSANPDLQRSSIEQQVLVNRYKIDWPVISSLGDYIKEKPKKFVLSCGFDFTRHRVYSMQPLASFLHSYCKVSAKDLLLSMTAYSAKQVHFQGRGVLKKGAVADLLILRCPYIEIYFETIGDNLIHREIKKGVPIFPYIIRV